MNLCLWAGAADFHFPFSSESFNSLPPALQKPSIHFQKLQKISANRGFSMGYGRTSPKKSRLPQTALLLRAPGRPFAVRLRRFPLLDPGPRPLLIGQSHFISRPALAFTALEAADFHSLPFCSESFNSLPRALQNLSIRFQKLQKISAERDFSIGYERKTPRIKSFASECLLAARHRTALRRWPSRLPLIHPGPRPHLIAQSIFLPQADINGRRPSRQAFVWKNRISARALGNYRTTVSRFAARGIAEIALGRPKGCLEFCDLDRFRRVVVHPT